MNSLLEIFKDMLNVDDIELTTQLAADGLDEWNSVPLSNKQRI